MKKIWRKIKILVLKMVNSFLKAFNEFKFFLKKKTIIKEREANKIMPKNKIKKSNKQVSNHAKIKKIIKNSITYIILGVLGLTVIGGGLFLLYIANTAPTFSPEKLYAKEATVIYDKDGREIAKLGIEKRENVTFDELSQVLIDAIIAVEDSRYYQHNGFDLPRFVKATGGQIIGDSGAGGASTLTMQIIKNNFTSVNQSVVRKFTDIYMSIFIIEKNYSKEEIMEFYVNGPYLGSGAYGVQQAAKVYFNKSVSDLNLLEASLIAGLFQAPGSYDPYMHPEAAEERRNQVLYLMKRHGYINDTEYKMAKSVSVESTLSNNQGFKHERSQYQGYIDVVVDEILAETGYNPYDTPMKIYTYMDTEKQTAINALMSGNGYEWEDQAVQAGFTVQNINTGEVIAIGNGRNIEGERSFNYATMIKRQPGSAAKPLFDFGPGIEYNNWSTGQMFEDAPYSYSNGAPISNWDNKYMGWITLRTAMAQSRNIPSLKAFQNVDNASIIKFVTALGLKPEIESGRIHEAHSIGGFTGVSPMELGAAYAAFGNGGYYIKPHTVNKIIYREDNDEQVFNREKTRAMKDSTAYMVTSTLQSAAVGISAGASVSGVRVAAKTGTTNLTKETIAKYRLPHYAHMDIWMVAYDPEYSISMWYGYDKLSTQYYLGNKSANHRNRLFRAVANFVWAKNNQDFKMPSSVVKVGIEAGSNPPKLPSANTPADKIIYELFAKGTEPTDVSIKYYGLTNVNNLKGTYDKVSSKIKLDWSYIAANVVDEKLGELGYEIFLNNQSLGFTKNNYFDYKYTGSATSLEFVIKTTFSNDRSQLSTGSSVTVPIISVSSLKCTVNDISPMIFGVVNTPMSLPGVTLKVDSVQLDKTEYTAKWHIKKGTNVVSGDSNFYTFDTTGLYILNYTCSYKGLSVDSSNSISITVTE